MAMKIIGIVCAIVLAVAGGILGSRWVELRYRAEREVLSFPERVRAQEKRRGGILSGAYGLLFCWSILTSGLLLHQQGLEIVGTPAFASAGGGALQEALSLIFLLAFVFFLVLYTVTDFEQQVIFDRQLVPFAVLGLLSLPLLAAMAIFLRVLNARHFFALLFGMVTPYWIAAAWGLWQGCADAMADQWLQQWTFTAPCYDALPAPAITGAALIAGISVPAIVHTLRTAYNDKIRTRMYFYTLTVLHLTLLGALAAQPQHYAMLLPLLTVTTAPLAAHHFTLSRGRSALLWFIICLTAIAAVIVGKICMLHGIVR